MAGSARLIGELTFHDVAQRVSVTSILCLPIGSVEQHGPHLPLNTDVVLAEGVTCLIVARWGDAFDLWQLPTVSVSLAREHEWAAGTLSLSVQGMTAYLHDLGRSLARALPSRNLLIVNGHGGNRGILETVAQDLRAEVGLNICIINPAAMADTHAASDTPDIHGGKIETSMMLAMAPQLVRTDRIADLQNPPDGDAIRSIILQKGVTWPWTSDNKNIADTGVIGDPKAATAAFGQGLIDRVVEQVGEILQQLRQRG
jgi:creatinine amidohydrolase/Fe(II)-dependent formamide hydrolase-like protein